MIPDETPERTAKCTDFETRQDSPGSACVHFRRSANFCTVPRSDAVNLTGMTSEVAGRPLQSDASGSGPTAPDRQSGSATEHSAEPPDAVTDLTNIPRA